MEKNAIEIKVAKNRLKAWIELIDSELLEEVRTNDLIKLLEKEKIQKELIHFDEANWKQSLQEKQQLVIAEGTPAVNGVDGYIDWKLSLDAELSEQEKSSFRDVKKIPSVTAETLLAEVIPPTEGKSGIDVYGNIVKQQKGRKVSTKAGQNVEFNEETRNFIAKKDGKLSVTDKLIQVFDMYELSGDVTLETGNIDFVGSVYIRGNVPAGYTVKAQGDIHVLGIVEAAYLKAGGNIVINGGVSGMDKAVIQADGDVRISYINQSSVESGNNLIVSKSILHSQCVAQESILCENGSIIGGTCSAGRQILVNTVGNFANTKTELALGINKNKRERLEYLKKEIDKLLNNKTKLKTLGNQLQDKKERIGLNAKERIMLLKQRNMYEKVIEQINEMEEEMDEMQFSIGNYTDMEVIVKGKAFDNVLLIFGKYSRKLDREFKYFKSYLKEMEIVIDSL
ncbi:DUF342 domain-containing protein [Gracilibacillus xinjiangensis]|uniref:DUF342 domain-containing protein n=1 Tax=Gracilibacillus xinjiangensis TaxID=1193282 RepID=A0ABV8WYK5_9BACI